MASQTHDAVVQYPGGLRVRFRWAGSGQEGHVFALSEVGGSLTDLGELVSADPAALCRAELRVETPSAPWTARLASPIFDQPDALAWDTAGLLVVTYGFMTYGFESRTGELRWNHRSGSPIIALLGSSRLEHVIVQAEIETFALDASGEVRWRIAHSDVVAEASLVGGQLALTSYAGQVVALDARTGRPVA
jgi:outer membrane protein assembly factor BamB